MRKMKANKILLLGCLFFSACAPHKETIYKDKYLFQNQSKRDSLVWIIKDSVHIQTKNDTVFVDSWHVRYRDREVIKNDSIYLTDTVYIETEKKLTLRERIVLNTSEYLIFFLIFVILILLIRNKK